MLISFCDHPLNPLRMGFNYGPCGEFAVLLPRGQLSGSPRQTQMLVIRDFATTSTCTCQHYCAIFMHSACVHVHM